MNDKINIALIVHESNSPLSMISVVRIKKYFLEKLHFFPNFSSMTLYSKLITPLTKHENWTVLQKDSWQNIQLIWLF